MQSLLSENFFDVAPNKHNAAIISQAYKNKALRSLRYISEVVSKKISTPYKIIETKLDKLAQLTHAHPSTIFYVLNTNLVRSLFEERNIKKIKEALDTLSLIQIKQCFFKQTQIVNLNSFVWAKKFADETVHDAKKISLYPEPKITPVSDHDFRENKKIARKALSILRDSPAKNYHGEVIQYVSHIILFDGLSITGGSSTRTMGSVYIRIVKKNCSTDNEAHELSLSHLTPTVYYLEQIVHETSHLHLDQLMEFDSIVLNKENENYPSPLRIDPRPMRGIFHAVFVLTRLLDMHRLLANDLENEDHKCCIKRQIIIEKVLKKGFQTINEYAQLTDLGKKILKRMEQITYDYTIPH